MGGASGCLSRSGEHSTASIDEPLPRQVHEVCNSPLASLDEDETLPQRIEAMKDKEDFSDEV